MAALGGQHLPQGIPQERPQFFVQTQPEGASKTPLQHLVDRVIAIALGVLALFVVQAPWNILLFMWVVTTIAFKETPPPSPPIQIFYAPDRLGVDTRTEPGYGIVGSLPARPSTSSVVSDEAEPLVERMEVSLNSGSDNRPGPGAALSSSTRRNTPSRTPSVHTSHADTSVLRRAAGWVGGVFFGQQGSPTTGSQRRE